MINIHDLASALRDITKPYRIIDTQIAELYHVYDYLLPDYEGDPPSFRNITYRPNYDDVEVRVTHRTDGQGGIRYSDKLKPYTGSSEAAKSLLPKDEGWKMEFIVGAYLFCFRGRPYHAPTEALAICQALVDIKIPRGKAHEA